MKTIILCCFTFLVSFAVSAHANFPRFSCSISKSVDLTIVPVFDKETRSVDLELATSHYLADSTEKVTTLKNVQIVHYGGTFIVMANRGRGGYAMMRIEGVHEKETMFNGYLDINLFGYDSICSHGHMVQTYCYKL